MTRHRTADGTLARPKVRLSGRHSEILTLLANRPEGMVGDELLAELYEDGSVTPVTLRAELSRLRGLLSPGRAVPLADTFPHDRFPVRTRPVPRDPYGGSVAAATAATAGVAGAAVRVGVVA
ncbi:hypothetical protein [Streptomyces sp. NPDC058280]|uniref:hypothetical protein n=1 Tax=Streptomyces sp. NPDC058280 TaxID=3346419 RepID=UPI0036F046FE